MSGEPAAVHFVVVGLGNPGAKYELTRHNIGTLVAKTIVGALGWSFKEDKRFKALTAKGSCKGKVLHVVLPQTYMNESGQAVGAYLNYYKLKPEAVLVICDDVELAFGQLRLRSQGRSGGHNGLKSIEAHLGTQEYLRLKMGVGKEVANATLADYVLDNFKPDEFAKLEGFIGQGVKVVSDLLSEPSAAVMNRVNRSVPPVSGPESPNKSILG
jgi:peptidyl-tRNA hydrolase, PTH1 family